VLTAEYKVNFLAAAKGERLLVRGKVVKPGHTLTVTAAEAFCVRDGDERLCAVMLQSLICVAAKP
jgi:acyl-coenzyme A thioesterase PaaI-like protein